MSGDDLRDHISKLGLNITLRYLGINEYMIGDVAKSVLNTTKRTLECCKIDIEYNDIVCIYEMSL